MSDTADSVIRQQFEDAVLDHTIRALAPGSALRAEMEGQGRRLVGVRLEREPDATIVVEMLDDEGGRLVERHGVWDVEGFPTDATDQRAAQETALIIAVAAADI